MHLTELTKAFISKAETEKTNIRKLAVELGLPYDRVYKWFKGKANQKPPDDVII